MLTCMRLLGVFCALFMMLIVAKYPARRLGLTKVNALLMKHHRRFFRALVVISLAHGLLSLMLPSPFSSITLVSGVLCLFFILLSWLSLRLQKQRCTAAPTATKSWLHCHRLYATFAFILLIVHIVLQAHDSMPKH